MAVEQRLYTVNDLWELAAMAENQDRDFELIDGELHEVTPNSLKSNLVAVKLIQMIGAFVNEHDLGYVTGTDAGFELGPRDVLEPDVAFIAKERIRSLPDRYFKGAPDLAVEVVSPTHSIKATHRKVKRYLVAGTRLAWIIYPADKSADVCTLTREGDMLIHEVTADDELDGSQVLPGFKLALKDVFKVLA